MNKCKYCGAPLTTDGYCSNPCKIGALLKKIAELKEKIKENKE